MDGREAAVLPGQPERPVRVPPGLVRVPPRPLPGTGLAPMVQQLSDNMATATTLEVAYKTASCPKGNIFLMQICLAICKQGFFDTRQH